MREISHGTCFDAVPVSRNTVWSADSSISGFRNLTIVSTRARSTIQCTTCHQINLFQLARYPCPDVPVSRVQLCQGAPEGWSTHSAGSSEWILEGWSIRPVERCRTRICLDCFYPLALQMKIEDHSRSMPSCQVRFGLGSYSRLFCVRMKDGACKVH